MDNVSRLRTWIWWADDYSFAMPSDIRDILHADSKRFHAWVRLCAGEIEEEDIVSPDRMIAFNLNRPYSYPRSFTDEKLSEAYLHERAEWEKTAGEKPWWDFDDIFKRKTKNSVGAPELEEHASRIEVKVRNSKYVKVIVNSPTKRSIRKTPKKNNHKKRKKPNRSNRKRPRRTAH